MKLSNQFGIAVWKKWRPFHSRLNLLADNVHNETHIAKHTSNHSAASMSFPTSIPHRPLQVRRTLHWLLVTTDLFTQKGSKIHRFHAYGVFIVQEHTCESSVIWHRLTLLLCNFNEFRSSVRVILTGGKRHFCTELLNSFRGLLTSLDIPVSVQVYGYHSYHRQNRQ